MKNKSDVDELQELSLAKSEGRLVTLPCRIGDTVHFHSLFKSGVISGRVIRAIVYENFISLDVITEMGSSRKLSAEDVFLSREEAEKALKRLLQCYTIYLS